MAKLGDFEAIVIGSRGFLSHPQNQNSVFHESKMFCHCIRKTWLARELGLFLMLKELHLPKPLNCFLVSLIWSAQILFRFFRNNVVPIFALDNQRYATLCKGATFHALLETLNAICFSPVKDL